MPSITRNDSESSYNLPAGGGRSGPADPTQRPRQFQSDPGLLPRPNAAGAAAPIGRSGDSGGNGGGPPFPLFLRYPGGSAAAGLAGTIHGGDDVLGVSPADSADSAGDLREGGLAASRAVHDANSARRGASPAMATAARISAQIVSASGPVAHGAAARFRQAFGPADNASAIRASSAQGGDVLVELQVTEVTANAIRNMQERVARHRVRRNGGLYVAPAAGAAAEMTGSQGVSNGGGEAVVEEVPVAASGSSSDTEGEASEGETTHPPGSQQRRLFLAGPLGWFVVYRW